MNKLNNLEYLNAYELGELVNKRVIKPSEVVRYFEKRIRERNKSINAIVYTNFDYAYSKAKELEDRLDRGEKLGPFAGVPVILKDFLPSKKGWYHSHGGVKCLVKEDPYDSVFTKAIEKGDGIIIGKANAPAYGFRGTTDNKMFGPTSTPFNIKYNAGGSSGGSAAAVADGLVLIGEGGDAGGSIRIPAACNNLFGFKASVGTIPSVCRPDAYSATHPLCFAGGLVKCVKDAAILLDLMKEYNVRDPYSTKCDIDFNKEMDFPIDRKYKIAYTRDFDLFEVEDDVREKVDKFVNYLKEDGFQVDEVHFNFKHSANELADQWCKGITIDCALELNHDKENGIDYLKDNENDFPEEFIHYKKICDNLTIEDMYKFNLARTDILDQFENVFENYDLIISPTMCCKPIKNKNDKNTKGPDTINGHKIESLIGWTQTFLVNFIGYPAASIPCGLLKNDLPCGVQLIGKKHRDIDVLDMSRIIESSIPWKQFYEIPFTRDV